MAWSSYDTIQMMSNGKTFDDRSRFLTPKASWSRCLGDLGDVRLYCYPSHSRYIPGLVHHHPAIIQPGAWLAEVLMNPMVFAGLYPIESNKYNDLREALGNLCASTMPVSNLNRKPPSPGFGFRCGFLGLLHMDVIQERWSGI